MRVPVRRLAGLWPWLLMAALQVVLGHTGLELAAAVESERSAPRAMIKVSLLKQEPTSRPITLEGVFAGGSAGYAEGKLMQGMLFRISCIFPLGGFNWRSMALKRIGLISKTV
ncbi:E3 ubiquitin-protein ligase RNF43 [Labeo rohita]|uniref:E3 ubiquitin-protein ligase RNF43 n=1 Tax=Labeo rohita TaxID=84645 RepID=A0ABQ8MQF6_LABRO|nr:E3 ubiquitin-protein ligase RNF43 [Labeo rohita]